MATISESLATIQNETNQQLSRARDMTPFLQVLARFIANLINKSFDERNDPFGGHWPDITPATIAIREITGDYPTGNLRNSISVTVSGNIITVSAGANYATEQFSGIPHNRLFGLSELVKPVPARNAIPIRDGSVAPQIEEFLNQHLFNYIMEGILPSG